MFVVSDIFGWTSALEEIARVLSPAFETIHLVDPYNHQEMEFENETDAYTYFKKQGGLKRYIRIVSDSLSQTTEPVRMLGFSVGASAIWALSDNQESPQITKAVCFYGSQIRHFPTVSPKIEMELFFPHVESHFDVMKLMAHISRYRNIHCYQTEYLHGFMNKYSENFNEHGYHYYLKIIKNKLV